MRAIQYRATQCAVATFFCVAICCSTGISVHAADKLSDRLQPLIERFAGEAARDGETLPNRRLALAPTNRFLLQA